APGAQAYPISSFTWLLIRPDMKDAAKGQAIKNFLEWMVTPAAGKMANELEYASLPTPVVALIKERLTTLKANGKRIK
ncbi:MAG: phosphate ABC transporter substrate-binding protein PstS, partial [Gemmatimonadales bacterium]